MILIIQSSTFPQTDIYSSLNAEYRLLRMYTDTRAPLAGDEMRIKLFNSYKNVLNYFGKWP